MAFNVGDRVYYLPEVFVVKSVVKTGVYRVQGSDSKIRKVAEAGTLFPSSITSRAEMTQTEAINLKAQVASLAIELESHKYQLQAFRDELAREKQTAEKCGQQKYLWQQAAQELQEERKEQKHELKKLKRKLKGWQEDYEYVIGVLDEERRQGDELRMNLEQLRESTKQMESASLYELLLVPSDASVEEITRKFRKLSVLCHPDQGGTSEIFVRLQRAHRILTDHNARAEYDVNGCEAADKLLTSKNNN